MARDTETSGESTTHKLPIYALMTDVGIPICFCGVDFGEEAPQVGTLTFSNDGVESIEIPPSYTGESFVEDGEMDEKKYPTGEELMERFGTWNKALEDAGMHPVDSSSAPSRHTDESITEQLRKLAEIDDSPTESH